MGATPLSEVSKNCNNFKMAGSSGKRLANLDHGFFKGQLGGKE